MFSRTYLLVLFALLTATVVITGCADNTAVDVLLESEPALLVGATGVRLRIFQGRNGALVRDTLVLFTDGLELPETATVVPADGDSTREFTALAELKRGEETVATQRLVSSFVPGRRVRVILRFTDGCTGTCGILRTCVERSCLSACFSPSGESLVRADCDAATDAGVLPDAARPDGDRPDTGIRPDGARPDAAVPDGTTPDTTPVADAGRDAFDGGLDAGPAPCGDRGFSEPWHACVDELHLGSTHTCALRDGFLYCWGDGMGANGMPARYLIADGSPGIDGLGQLTTGSYSTCVLSAVGHRVECMGLTPRETLPLTSTRARTAITIPSASRPDLISARDGMVCGIDDGVLACFGVGGDLVMSNNLVEWNDVQVGAGHICGLANGSSLYCWGDNSRGQVFRDALESPFVAAPARIDFGTLIVRGGPMIEGTLANYSVGAQHTCFIMASGGTRSLYCVGYNEHGELGGGFGGGHGSLVPMGDGYEQVSAGDQYTCAVTTAGGLDCWGRNHMGQLGNGVVNAAGDYAIFHLPAPERGVWQQVITGSTHTCALTSDHSLYCWGSNADGQLSINTCDAGPFPTPTHVVHQFRSPTGCE